MLLSIIVLADISKPTTAEGGALLTAASVEAHDGSWTHPAATIAAHALTHAAGAGGPGGAGGASPNAEASEASGVGTTGVGGCGVQAAAMRSAARTRERIMW